jgi:CubicO group peptidase (beta-lactamase class C family)
MSEPNPTRLPRATAESQGVASGAIAAFVAAAEERGHRLHSLMVLRHGTVIAEGWWAPYTEHQEHMMFSVSKTVTATAIGIAQDERLLSVDDPVLSFFPSLATDAVRRNVRHVRVRHLLAMATGHDVDTMEIMRAQPHADWVKVFLDVPIVFPPGEHFLYNSGASFVLSAIISARTGMTVREYLRSRLFEPLGILPPPWEGNLQGIPYGASGLRITTEDLAKLGQLYLRRGVWGGRRLLSEAWVETATAQHVDNGVGDDDWSQGYGFQIWRSRHDSYRFDGRYGQFAFVLPAQDVVVAITAGATDNRSMTSTLWETLLPGVRPTGEGALAEDAAAASGLTTLLDSREVDLPVFLPEVPAPLRALGDRQIRLPFNTLHATAVRLGFGRLPAGGDAARLTIEHDGGRQETVSAGRDEWVSGVTALWPYEEMSRALVESRAGAVSPTRYEIHQQCVETPFRRIWRFDVAGASDRPDVTVTVWLDNGFWVERTEVLAGSLA